MAKEPALGQLAHDLNNALQTIVGSLSTLEKLIEMDQLERAPRFIAAALRSAHRAGELTQDLQQIARRNAADPPLTAPLPEDLSARILERVPLYQGFLSLYRYDFEIEKHEGGTERITREVMERGDAVAVLGYDPQRDEVVLCSEFRPGVLIAGEYPFRENLVAGAIDAGESAIAAAVREMQEEAGLELRDPVLIHRGAFVSSGGTSERIALVFGTVDTSNAGGVHGMGDEQEDILTVVLPAQVFIDRVRSAAINDLKTLVAGYWFADYRAR